MRTSRTIEYTVAVASFVAAMVFAFVSLAIAEAHEVAAGNWALYDAVRDGFNPSDLFVDLVLE